MLSALKAKAPPLVIVNSPAQDAPLDAARQESSATDACPRCYDTGMEVVPGKGARRCECRRQDDRAKLLEAARIPRRYQNCSLSNYQLTPGNGSQLQAFNYSFKLIDEYPAMDRGLLFAGSSDPLTFCTSSRDSDKH